MLERNYLVTEHVALRSAAAFNPVAESAIIAGSVN
jgi:hypothetical protein